MKPTTRVYHNASDKCQLAVSVASARVFAKAVSKELNAFTEDFRSFAGFNEVNQHLIEQIANMSSVTKDWSQGSITQQFFDTFGIEWQPEDVSPVLCRPLHVTMTRWLNPEHEMVKTRAWEPPRRRAHKRVGRSTDESTENTSDVEPERLPTLANDHDLDEFRHYPNIAIMILSAAITFCDPPLEKPASPR